MKTDSTPKAETTSALYRAVWRWHFYAGIVAAPFAIFLAITGALYLFKPHYEEWKYRDLFNIPVATTPPLSVEAQLAAAQAAKPGQRINQFIPAFTPGRTAEAQFGPPRFRGSDAKKSSTSSGGMSHSDGQRSSVYINPYTGAIVGEIADQDREMLIVRQLHGSMLAGLPGEILIELSACWMFVLLLTGFYLWWPRPKFSVWGFLLPRLRSPGRVFWRDLHAVPAVWLAAGSLFILSSGLPWTKYSGPWLRQLSAYFGEGTPREMNAMAHRSDLTGWSPPLKAGLATQIENLASTPPPVIDEHAEHRGHAPAAADTAAACTTPRLSLDRVMEIAREKNVPEPYALALPVGPTGVTSVLSHYYRANVRTYLHLDQYSGKVLADVRYKDLGLYGKFVILGIAIHEGHFFGWLNLALGLAVCLGIILLSVTGIVLWWKRRPAGKLAAPVSQARLPRPILWGTLVMALFMPLLAATLVLLLLGDPLFARRINAASSLS